MVLLLFEMETLQTSICLLPRLVSAFVDKFVEKPFLTSDFLQSLKDKNGDNFTKFVQHVVNEPCNYSSCELDKHWFPMYTR